MHIISASHSIAITPEKHHVVAACRNHCPQGRFVRTNNITYLGPKLLNCSRSMCYYLPRHVKTYKLFKISAILILSSWLPDLLSDRQRLRFFGLKDVLLYLGSCNSSTCFLFWDRIEFGTASIKWIFVGLVASTRTFDQLVHPDDSVAKEWAEATKGWSWAQNQGPRWSQNLSSGHRWTTPFFRSRPGRIRTTPSG